MRRHRLQIYSEIEESLSNNKKVIEIFQRIKKKEDKVQKINLLITLLILAESVLAVLVFAVCMNTNLLPEFTGIPLLLIMGILFLTILRLSDKAEFSISNEIHYINSVLKEEAKCEETEIIQSGGLQYIEVHSGKDLQLICINDGKCPGKIESCLVSYYKNIELSRYAETFFVKTTYRIFVQYQGMEEPKLIKEN
ncbi:MAG: hypothetical protein ACLUJV_02535 [Blautia producta]